MDYHVRMYTWSDGLVKTCKLIHIRSIPVCVDIYAILSPNFINCMRLRIATYDKCSPNIRSLHFWLHNFVNLILTSHCYISMYVCPQMCYYNQLYNKCLFVINS